MSASSAVEREPALRGSVLTASVRVILAAHDSAGRGGTLVALDASAPAGASP